MDFSEALQQLKDGLYMSREAWGVEDVVFIENEEFTKTVDGGCVDWTPTHDDLLAEDWYAVA